MSKSITRVVLSPLDTDVNHLGTKVMDSFRRSEVVEVRMPIPFNVFCLRNPEDIKVVTSRKESTLRKPDLTLPKANLLMGNGLFNDGGADAGWKAKRQELAPVFSNANAAAMCESLVPLLDAFATRLAATAGETSIDVYTEALRVVLDYSFEALFSERLGAELDWVAKETVFAEKMFTDQIPYWIPTPSNLRLFRVRRKFRALFDGVIARRRERLSATTDALHHLLAAEPPSGCPVHVFRKTRDVDIRSQMFSLFFGASAMTFPVMWGIFFMARKPGCLAKIRAELDSVIGDRAARAEDLAELPYLDRFVREVMRIYPAFWGSLRYASKAMSFNGYDFPARSVFIMARHAAHRHPDHWTDPDEFDPDRFAPDSKDRGPGEAFIPYGAGPRLCIGRPLAKLVVPLMLARMAQLLDLDVVSPDTVTTRFGFALYPAEPLLVRAQRRAARRTE